MLIFNDLLNPSFPGERRYIIGSLTPPADEGEGAGLRGTGV